MNRYDVLTVAENSGTRHRLFCFLKAPVTDSFGFLKRVSLFNNLKELHLEMFPENVCPGHYPVSWPGSQLPEAVGK